MILGTNRVPLHTPEAAIPGFTPGLPATGFYSHFHPLTMVTHAMSSMRNAYRPPLQPQMGPQMLPAVPMPAPVTTATPAPTAPTVPAPGGTAGAGFGSTGGTRLHTHVDPYRVMRQGMIPGVFPNGSNIRAGYQNAFARVHNGFPFQTAPLPVVAPAPVAPTAVVTAPAPAPGGTKGLMGALFGRSWRGRGRHPHMRRARRHHWWQLNPPSTQEQVVAQAEQCETYPPNIDGIKKTVCNGRVVRYEDAAGNVRIPGQLPPGFAGW